MVKYFIIAIIGLFLVFNSIAKDIKNTTNNEK